MDYKKEINKKEINKTNKEKKSSASASQNPQTTPPTATEDNKTVYETIIAYLNKKAGTNYRPTSSDTKKHINARLSEGYTINDFLADLREYP